MMALGVAALLLLSGLAAAEQALPAATEMKEFQGSCFQFGQCNECLQNPECGWCAESELCYKGGPTGPECGSAITSPCTLWVWKEPEDGTERGAGASCGFADMQQMFAEAKVVGAVEDKQSVLKLDKARTAVHDASLIPKDAIVLD